MYCYCIRNCVDARKITFRLLDREPDSNGGGSVIQLNIIKGEVHRTVVCLLPFPEEPKECGIAGCPWHDWLVVIGGFFQC